MPAFIQAAYYGSRCGFSWAQILWLLQSLAYLSEWLTEDDVIELCGMAGNVQLKALFPIRALQVPGLALAPHAEATFRISTDVHLNRMMTGDSAWATLLSSGTLRVFERKTRARSSLRYGFSREEACEFGDALHKELRRLVATGEKLAQSGIGANVPVAAQPGIAGVSIWIDGELRGSAIAQEVHYSESAYSALMAAYHDRRFSPISTLEADRAMIEFALIQPRGLDVRSFAFPEGDLAYRCQSRQGRAGWYLPEVFNVREFSSAREFFRSLAAEKANAPLRTSSFSTHVIESWLISQEGEALPLRGAGRRVDAHELDALGAMEGIAKAVLGFLAGMQMPDGSLPQSVHPKTGRRHGFDLDRMAHALWSLSEAEKAFPHLPAAPVRERLEAFMLARKEECAARPLCAAFLARYFLVRNDDRFKGMAFAAVRPHHASDRERLLLASYLVPLFEAMPELLRVSEPPGAHITRMLDGHLLHGLNPAWYSEAAAAFRYINPFMADRIRDAIHVLQRQDGSFCDDHPKLVPYVRGAGKVFESLAAFPEEWESSARPALQWLLSMQVADGTDHWVIPELRPRLKGGFRHDVLNQAMWMDAASHVLIGCARRALSIRGQ